MNTRKLSMNQVQRMHKLMSGYVEKGVLPGLVTLLSMGDEIYVDTIGMKEFGGSEEMKRDTIFRIASMTKPITAAAVMMLVEERKLRLDEPVDRFLPELEDRRVLMRLDTQIHDTVPANRAITLRDLLTFKLGIGLVMAPPDKYPIQTAMAEAGLAPGPNPPSLTPDEWMKRLGSLPLIYQPGDKWMYHTGSDILGVLVARVSGMTFEQFLRERIFEPLGMKDTGFHVPAEKLDRLPTSYKSIPGTGEIIVHDDPGKSHWGSPPAFQSGGGGLVSTVDDYFAFCKMMLNKGRYKSEQILTKESVELMTADHLTSQQKDEARIFFDDDSSWGFGVGVSTHKEGNKISPGRFGWNGGIGTSGYSDSKEDMVGILMTQLLLDSPQSPDIFRDFWTSVHRVISE